MAEVEIWKSLEFLGYPEYEVSNFGQVKSLERVIIRKNGRKQTFSEIIMKPSKDKDGYSQLSLSKNGKRKTFRIHQLIAFAFITNDNPTEKTQVNHKDENKENNHASNLCWCSCIENINYGTRNERVGRANKGKKRSEETKQKMCESRKGKPQYKHRKPILQYTKDMVFVRVWDSATQAEKELNINKSSISACCKGKLKSAYNFIWKYKENNTNLVIS